MGEDCPGDLGIGGGVESGVCPAACAALAAGATRGDGRTAWADSRGGLGVPGQLFRMPPGAFELNSLEDAVRAVTKLETDVATPASRPG